MNRWIFRIFHKTIRLVEHFWLSSTMILDIGKENIVQRMMKKRCCRKKQTKNYYWILFWWKKYQKFVETFTFIKLYVVILTKRTEKIGEKKTRKKCSSRCSDMAGKASSLTCWANTRILVISTMNINLIYSYRFLFFDSSIMTTISCTTHQENLYGI